LSYLFAELNSHIIFFDNRNERKTAFWLIVCWNKLLKTLGMRYRFIIFLLVSLFVQPALAVKKKPNIVGQYPVSTTVGQPVTIELTDLIVEDENGQYPSGFTLEVFNGKDYSVSGQTVIPDAGFLGTLRIPVRVSDDKEESKKYDLLVDVVVANDEPPTITGQVPLTTEANAPITILFSHLTVSDPDSNYPDGFTLIVASGTNYTVDGTTVTPANGFSGTLSVPVTINDGESDSNTFNVQITVNAAANQPPVITGQSPLSTPENTPQTILLSHLTVSDPDDTYPDGFSLNVSPGFNYSVSGTTITPASEFSGVLEVPVTVNDGTDSSEPFTLSITVTAVNTQPVITGQVALTTTQGDPITLQLSHLTVSDADNDYPNGFTLAVAAGSNYTVTGTTVTPSAEFAGNLTVPVTVNDGTTSSDPFNVTISVTDVNTPPTITGQVALSTPRNTAITLQLSNLTVSDPDDTYPTGFTMSVSPGTNYTVSGNTVTPANNFTGNLSVPVTVNDGTDSSAPFNVTIGVNAPANVAPSITGQIPLTITENQSLTIQLAHLTVTDPDDSYPTGFTLNVQPGNNYTVSGSSITPALDFTGTLFVRVTVNDGEADSQPFNLSITVSPRQNTTPVITGQVPLAILKNQPLLIQLSHLTVTDPDNNFPADFTLSVIGGANYSVAGNIITPAQNFVGDLLVKLTVNDGFVSSASFNLRVTVNDVVVNQPPVITGQVGLTTFKNTPIRIALTNLVVSDPDDSYPTGFTLRLSPGINYTLSGLNVVPAANFLGTLAVNVTVNDGENDSAPFPLKIQVVEKGELQITGQVPLTVLEDSSLTIALTDLKVSDPKGVYPRGFTLGLQTGDNYAVEGNKIIPAPDFSGNLNVGVTVSNGTSTSPLFNMLVVVAPLNDAPRVDHMNPDPLIYNIGSGSVIIDDAVVAVDVDDEVLLLAEIGVRPEYYQAGSDILEFDDTENIRGIFDPEEGVLSLIGSASLEEYTAALRSVRYGFLSEGDTTPVSPKIIYYRLNDGTKISDYYDRTIVTGEIVLLDIPNVFTPNEDLINDTWKITASKESGSDQSAIVRIYNMRGAMVYEGKGLDHEWDGKLNGEFLPAAVYYYTIDMNLPYAHKSYKGSVTIMR
jgi:gliding motility-associated-like protein